MPKTPESAAISRISRAMVIMAGAFILALIIQAVTLAAIVGQSGNVTEAIHDSLVIHAEASASRACAQADITAIIVQRLNIARAEDELERLVKESCRVQIP
jgi:hypothetical protein